MHKSILFILCLVVFFLLYHYHQNTMLNSIKCPLFTASLSFQIHKVDLDSDIALLFFYFYNVGIEFPVLSDLERL